MHASVVRRTVNEIHVLLKVFFFFFNASDGRTFAGRAISKKGFLLKILHLTKTNGGLGVSMIENLFDPITD